jgi:hypothetical protein
MDSQPEDRMDRESAKESRERWYVGEMMAGLALVLVIGNGFYMWLYRGHLEHSALVFIGLPAVLAVAAVLLPRPATAVGAIMRAITVALCLSSVLFGEGFVCIFLAAPLFYGVGLVIGLVIDRVSRKREEPPRALSCLLLLAFLPFSLEGVIPGFEVTRDARVTVERVVDAAPAQVEAALTRTPRFDRQLPAFFRRLRFPTPRMTGGEGLAIGDRRTIEFLHNAHNAGHHPGVLTLEVREHEPRRVLFAMTEDSSYLTHWLTWQHAEVTWQEIAPGRTRVTWTLTYRRRLDPAWYFGPLERYGVGLAAGYLIETLASPSAAAAPALVVPATPSASHASGAPHISHVPDVPNGGAR